MERLSEAESQAYYDLRARGSKIGAWASAQSTVLEEGEGGRAALEKRVTAVEERFESAGDGPGEIPVPGFWGGIRVVPTRVEFWQGRESRLHDRFVYTRVGEEGVEDEGEGWRIQRLSP